MLPGVTTLPPPAALSHGLVILEFGVSFQDRCESGSEDKCYSWSTRALISVQAALCTFFAQVTHPMRGGYHFIIRRRSCYHGGFVSCCHKEGRRQWDGSVKHRPLGAWPENYQCSVASWHPTLFPQKMTLLHEREKPPSWNDTRWLYFQRSHLVDVLRRFAVLKPIHTRDELIRPRIEQTIWCEFVDKNQFSGSWTNWGTNWNLGVDIPIGNSALVQFMEFINSFLMWIGFSVAISNTSGCECFLNSSFMFERKNCLVLVCTFDSWAVWVQGC